MVQTPGRWSGRGTTHPESGVPSLGGGGPGSLMPPPPRWQRCQRQQSVGIGAWVSLDAVDWSQNEGGRRALDIKWLGNKTALSEKLQRPWFYTTKINWPRCCFLANIQSEIKTMSSTPKKDYRILSLFENILSQEKRASTTGLKNNELHFGNCPNVPLSVEWSILFTISRRR